MITKTLFIAYDSPFDEGNNLFQLFSIIYSLGETIVILGYREDSLLFSDEGEELRNYISSEFSSKGKYDIIDYRNEIVFSVVGEIEFNFENFQLLKETYRYFYSVVFSKKVIDYDNLIKEGKSLFKNDLYDKRKTEKGILNYSVIKGLVDNQIYLTVKGPKSEIFEIEKKLSAVFEVEEVI